MKTTNFTNKLDQFFKNLELSMKSNNVYLLDHWSIDHVCYRVETIEKYKQMKDELSQVNKLLIESEVNGRQISTFKLSNSVEFLHRQIDLLELPAPKPGKFIKEGFEHIEVVCDESFDSLQNRFSHMQFGYNGVDKLFNAELAMRLDHSTIKFHHLSLNSVVNLEKNKEVFDALTESRVLEHCQQYNPHVVGTFPLEIYNKNSDVDILLSSDNLSEVESRLTSIYGNYENYHSNYTEQGSHKFLVTQFSINNILFELYCENKCTFKQRGFIHFQIEERLLRLGGESFKNKIIELRERGFKTEPAFARALNLVGDPYIKLLEIHKMPELTLKDYFAKH